MGPDTNNNLLPEPTTEHQHRPHQKPESPEGWPVSCSHPPLRSLLQRPKLVLPRPAKASPDPCNPLGARQAIEVLALSACSP